MTEKNLQAWLDSFENTQKQIDSPAPERCHEMLRRLNIEKWCPIVTVGGTNGKGSTVYCLSAYALAMGKKVGRFTSPHLLNYNERIAINGVDVLDIEIVKAFERIKAVQADLYLGYFDYAFLAAIIIFKEADVNFMVLEVGLGGRLDATNSLDADCAIITTIDFDHTEILGNTREVIGFEKAGIFRLGKIAICGDVDAPSSVRRYAEEVGAQWVEPKIEAEIDLPRLYFPKQNAVTALTALRELDQFNILPFDYNVFLKVVQDLHIPGRMQVLQSHPVVMVDVAHNPQSVAHLLQTLKGQTSSGRRIAVFSVLMDKDIRKILEICNGFFDEWNVLQLNHSRAMPLESMVKCLVNESIPNSCIYSFTAQDDLMASLVARLNEGDKVIVFGSFFIVNLFLNWYNGNKKSLEYL